MRITVVEGDITEQHVDAIVNAANSTLMGGGGVDGAIHRAGGPAILEACRKIRDTSYPDGLPPGKAVSTTAGDLPARWVIHTVGPIYLVTPDGESILASCHRESLAVADSLGARTIAFPAISTGAYAWPVRSAAEIAVKAVHEADTEAEEVRFILFDKKALRYFTREVDG